MENPDSGYNVKRSKRVRCDSVRQLHIMEVVVDVHISDYNVLHQLSKQNDYKIIVLLFCKMTGRKGAICKRSKYT